ncbi:MAG: hypothetical protein ACE5K8_03885 [Candidatus Zixiibacteriota bacterium]
MCVISATRSRLTLPTAWIIVAVFGFCSQATSAPKRFSLDECYPIHNIGKIVLDVGYPLSFGWWHYYQIPDCLTGIGPAYPGAEYPKGSNVSYLLGAMMWVGGVLGGDTLVSDLREIRPVDWPEAYVEYRSILDPAAPEFEGAISEQDFTSVGIDTFTEGIPLDDFSHRPHKPLYVELTSRSYAWSYSYAEDFVLFDLSIKNIGKGRIKDAYVAFYIWPDVGFKGGTRFTDIDDIGGFVRTVPAPGPCGFIDTLNIMWWADNDGDPVEGVFTDQKVMTPEGDIIRSCPDINGIYLIHPPAVAGRSEWGKATLSYNWWYRYPLGGDDWGPMQRANYRDFGTGRLGLPPGNRNQYYVISNGEIDYDQAYTAVISPFHPVWLPPPQDLATDIPDGIWSMEYLLSIGPFDIDPGATMSLVFAYVAGEDFHTDPNNINNLPYNPDAYYQNLDFSDLAKNAKWAEWVYDNPGIDTDSDGYAGEFRVCASESILTDSGWVYTRAETTWYKGDGIPDWRAATPPPAPYFWIEPIVNGLHTRFNGERSETTEDVFLHRVDFEGYRIYLARDERATSYTVVASYDRENYDKYVWNPNAFPEAGWELHDIPYTLDSLRCLYGFGENPCQDSLFDPLTYTRVQPYVHPQFPDSLFFFVKHDYNVSKLGVSTPIRKVYPDEPDPSTLPLDSLTPDRYTKEGHLKYYEYEFTIEGLLPTVPYWVNVTAFDFGSPKSGLEALETSITLGAQDAYPVNPYDVEHEGKVYAYPNPYRINAGYRQLGYEGRTRENFPSDKVRAIHFANLPPKCTIKIFTLDGDRIITIEHDMDPSDPNASHDQWNLINRNHQLVVSGLYYWTVETPNGEVQIGKLVIIM